MSIPILLMYISALLWIFPIFRQYKTRMFYFFLALGLADPLNISSLYFWNFKVGVIHSIVALLLFYSLDYRDRKKFELSYKDILVLALYVFMLILIPNLYYLILVVHILVFGKILQIAIVELHHRSEINIFYLVLIFYQLTMIINIYILVSKIEKGIILFYITNAFQLLVAIFFTIFREDNPQLTVKIT